MSDPEEDEDDMPEDKDSTCSGVASEDKGDEDRDDEDEVVVADVVVADVDRDGDGDGETRGEDEEEDSSDDFFDAGEGAVIGPDRLSSRAASESGQSGSGGGTEDDPVGPITPSAAAGPTATIPHNNNNNKKLAAVDFSSRTISSTSTDLDDEEWVDPTPIPPTPLESAPPTSFPPPIIAKTKSSSSAKSRKRKEPRVAHVPFPSSVAEGVQEDRPRRIPQMSTARGRDGGRTQSGGVKGVIAPDPDPGMAEPDDDPDGDDF